MNTCKRIIALFATFAICLSLFVVPAYAVPALPASGGSVSVGYADFLLQYMYDHADDAVNGAINKINSIFNSDVCTSGKAENGRHNFVRQMTEVDGQTGEYYVCEYCGKSGGEVFDSAYDSYVDGMPVNGIDSSGSFYWFPTVNDVCVEGEYGFNFVPSANKTTIFYHSVDDYNINNTWHGNLSASGRSFDVIFAREDGQAIASCKSGAYFVGCLYLKAPVSGSYTLLENKPNVTANIICTDGHVVHFESSDLWYDDNSKSGYRDSGRVFRVEVLSTTESYNAYYVRAIYSFILPSYRVQITEDGINQDDYTPDTRPGTITGKYLVQNGDAYEDSSTTIINEDDNSIYNPVTNTTTNYDSWSYDYSTRTYTMTDNTNNSVSTVTYGDENITINEGGNTYNVYYGTVINNNDGGDDGGNGGNNSGSGGELIEVPNIDQNQLEQFWSGIKGLFVQLPQMFGDVTEFLRDGWAYVPDELMTLIEFGLGMVVTVGMINWIFKR